MNAHGPPLDELGKEVDEESGMVRLCVWRHQGPLQEGLKGEFVSAQRVEGEGLKERQEGRRTERN